MAILDFVSSLWHDTTIRFEHYPMPARLLTKTCELLDGNFTQACLNEPNKFLLISQLVRRNLF